MENNLSKAISQIKFPVRYVANYYETGSNVIVDSDNDVICDVLKGSIVGHALAEIINGLDSKLNNSDNSDLIDTMLTDYYQVKKHGTSGNRERYNEARKELERRLNGLDGRGNLQEGYQTRVDKWMQVCFGEEISKDKVERNHRFLEESLELVQSLGCTKSEAHQLVDYVFDRPQGEPYQECGGVMVTLAALCLANELEMAECGEIELKRIWANVEKIRDKQAQKPKHSPLPQAPDRQVKSAEEILRENLKYGNRTSIQDWVDSDNWVFKDHVLKAMEIYANHYK